MSMPELALHRLQPRPCEATEASERPETILSILDAEMLGPVCAIAGLGAKDDYHKRTACYVTSAMPRRVSSLGQDCADADSVDLLVK
jgi:hypothetical protein